MLDWQQKRHPTATWAERYRSGFDSSIAFLDDSRKARDAAVEAERERQLAEQEKQRRELVRTRVIAAILGSAFVLAVGSGIYAVIAGTNAARAQKQTAIAETAAKSDRQLADEKTKLADEKTRSADVEKHLAEEARSAEAKAEAAEARTRKTADVFIAAVKALSQVEASDENVTEKRTAAERAKYNHESADAIAEAEAEYKLLDQSNKEIKLDAARKMADGAAILANAHIIKPSQISSSDLFDLSKGSVVTGWSGRGSGSNTRDKGCGLVSAVTMNPNDMFSGSGGSACKSTVFADELPVGTEHWIEWKTRNEVTLASVGLFAAHNRIGSRRSFREFELYVKQQGKWHQIADYHPSLMYGGSCGDQPCFPPPAEAYVAGSVLASCINVVPTKGQEFRAVFVQTVPAYAQFSGPRLLQLDGYPNANCAK
jgi:hypothetical protein